MKQKKIFTGIIFSLLVVFNVYSLFRFNEFKKRTAIENGKKLKEEEITKDKLDTYKASFEENLLNDGENIDSILLAKDSLSATISLKNTFGIGQKHILIYRFSKMHCESCVKASLGVVKRYINSIGNKNVMFLGDYKNNRIFYRTVPYYGIEKVKVYNFPSFDISAENIGYPYFFVLNNNLEISDVFIPNKATKEITEKYLSLIQKKYNFN